MNHNLIVETMHEKGITIEQLVELSAVPKSTLVRILNGTTESPGFQTVADIAVALDLDLNELAGIEIEKAHADHHAQVVYHSNSVKVEQMYRSMIFERDHRIAEYRRWLIVSVVINAVQLIYQMLRWMLDIANPEIGWIRLDDADITFAAVFAIVLFALVVICGVMFFAFRKKKE